MSEMIYLEILEDPVVEAVEAGGEESIELQVVSENTTLELEISEYIEITEQGPTGAPGPAGATYVHTQSSASATWTINHNLNTVRPVVVILDSEPGRPQWADVDYPTLNQAVVQLDVPSTGKAYL